MKIEKKAIGRRIKAALENSKITQRQLSKSLGISEPSVSAYIQGTSNLPAEAYSVISELCNVSIDWLIKGEEKHRLPEPLAVNPEAFLSDEYVMVPRYEISASAGGGAVVHSEQIVDYLAFRGDWLRNVLGVPGEALALIDVRGDSMEPTLSDGDLILIDLRTFRIDADSVYVLQVDGSLVVKRIQKNYDGTVEIVSDNPRYKPHVLGPESAERLGIVGRVVWSGRKM